MTAAFDTHVHVWGTAGADASRRSGIRPVAADAYDAPDLLADLDACEVRGAVLVAPLLHGFDARFTLARRDAHPDRFAVLGRVDLARGDPGAAVEALADRGAAGVRLHAVEQLADRRSEQRAVALCHALREHGMVLSVYAPLRTSLLERLAAAIETAPLLVDHLALPAAGEDGMEPADAVSEALALVTALSDARHVALKLSALPLLQQRYGLCALVDLLEHVAAAWGADRLLWGSDMPRMSASGLSYREQVLAARTLLARVPAFDARHAMHDAAAALFDPFLTPRRSVTCTTTAC